MCTFLDIISAVNVLEDRGQNHLLILIVYKGEGVGGKGTKRNKGKVPFIKL